MQCEDVIWTGTHNHVQAASKPRNNIRPWLRQLGPGCAHACSAVFEEERFIQNIMVVYKRKLQ